MSKEKSNNNTGHMNTIQSACEIAQKHQIGRISYETENLKFTIETQPSFTAPIITQPAPQIINTSTPTSIPVQEKTTATDIDTGNKIKSPMVGMIYTAPKPGDPPFIKVGDKITKGQSLFIIEIMKTFNTIKSDFDGVVKEILVKNEQPVEFDQGLAIIE